MKTSIDDYEKPKIDKFSLFISIMHLSSAVAVSLMLWFSSASIFAGLFVVGVAFEIYGTRSNPRKRETVHIYRPYSGLLCLLLKHRYFVNCEWLMIRSGLLTCERCGDNAFVDRVKAGIMIG